MTATIKMPIGTSKINAITQSTEIINQPPMGFSDEGGLDLDGLFFCKS